VSVELTSVCLWENKRNKKYTLSLSLELIKVGGYDFHHPCDGPQNSHLFFKQPLVDTVFDLPGADQVQFCSVFNFWYAHYSPKKTLDTLACIVCLDNIDLESSENINLPQGFYTYIFKIFSELLAVTVHPIT
jgi:hypothetical protein